MNIFVGKKSKHNQKFVSFEKTSVMGIEPTTFGLGGRCSTFELHGLSDIPHNYLIKNEHDFLNINHIKNLPMLEIPQS